jgi:N-acetylglucosaminyldiphosphoundecaprenol N-acetyl-beta-D-mannosaminyltransferase
MGDRKMIAEVARPKVAVRVPGKQCVAGVYISKVNYAGVVDTVRGWIAQTRQNADAPARYITVTSVHGIVTARKDAEVLRILNGAAMATSDGMPVVWAMRSFGVKDQQRVYGPTLMLELCRDAAERGHNVFLYGSSPRCVEQLRDNLGAQFPGLPVVGAYSPPFRPLTPEEDAGIIEKIRDSGAEIVFVGISTPKQEKWMAEHVPSLPGVIMVGVGAAFDFHAGLLRQAPPWMQRNGLEWFYRLCAEPKRLWRRYVLETPRFLPLWALQKLGWMRFD